MAQRRRRNIQARGGAAKMQFLSDGNEIPQVAQFHPRIIR
jgi:hypothetical protein